MLFADNCNKLNKKLKKKRCILLISERAVYVFAIKKNPTKDKEEKRVKPWVFICKRRILHKDVRSLVLSTMQDSCVNLQVQVRCIHCLFGHLAAFAACQVVFVWLSR